MKISIFGIFTLFMLWQPSTGYSMLQLIHADGDRLFVIDTHERKIHRLLEFSGLKAGNLNYVKSTLFNPDSDKNSFRLTGHSGYEFQVIEMPNGTTAIASLSTDQRSSEGRSTQERLDQYLTGGGHPTVATFGVPNSGRYGDVVGYPLGEKLQTTRGFKYIVREGQLYLAIVHQNFGEGVNYTLSLFALEDGGTGRKMSSLKLAPMECNSYCRVDLRNNESGEIDVGILMGEFGAGVDDVKGIAVQRVSFDLDTKHFSSIKTTHLDKELKRLGFNGSRKRLGNAFHFEGDTFVFPEPVI